MYCETKKFNIGKLFLDKDSIDTAPEYQRQAGVWGKSKRQLFLHSLFAQYDAPKIYMQKLPANEKHEYALVDGKQRLQCIVDFMENKITLGEAHAGFVPVLPGHEKHKPYPSKGDRFGDLSDFWKEQFKAVNLDIAVIYDADGGDVEAMFSRLNTANAL